MWTRIVVSFSVGLSSLACAAAPLARGKALPTRVHLEPGWVVLGRPFRPGPGGMVLHRLSGAGIAGADSVMVAEDEAGVRGMIWWYPPGSDYEALLQDFITRYGSPLYRGYEPQEWAGAGLRRATKTAIWRQGREELRLSATEGDGLVTAVLSSY